MATIARLLWLGVHLLSHVYAQEGSTSGTVKWLEAERSVLIHLPTPDLHFCTSIAKLSIHLTHIPRHKTSRESSLIFRLFPPIRVILIRNVREGNQRDWTTTHFPGALIFNFTLTTDNLTLLLNNEPILPRTHPYIPTPLRAHQTPESGTYFANRACTNFSTAPTMDLDYYISTPDPTSATSIWNTKYNPRLQIDILRASIPSDSGYSTPLSSNSQQQIWLWLEDIFAHPPNTLYSKIPLKIKDVKVDRRWFWHNMQGGDHFIPPQSLKTCHIWSWLCADIPNYPYYEYIYRMHFDQYGKKGSMRHFVTERWGWLVGFIGLRQAIALLGLCANIGLSLVVYALFRAVKHVIDMYRMRMQEVDEWVADEELDEEGEDSVSYEEVRKEKIAAEEGGEKMGLEESLIPPPHNQMKAEKTPTS